MELHENNYNDRYKEDFRFLDDCPFIVCSMFTPDTPELFLLADRLARSCEKYALPFSIYRVPEIHKSLAPSGKYNLSFTKANCIYFNLMRFPDKNIFYLDTDMFFIDYPAQIFQISNSRYDFGVYNWLNDEHNEAYVPVNGKLEMNNRDSDFYIFSHSIDFFSTEQLISSGGVQFYRNSPQAKQVLESWQDFVARYPDYPEDQALDYVYNNFFLHSVNLKAFWLDKSYIRFPWWPHIKPVIIHPGMPSGGRSHLVTEINNLKRFYPEKCKYKSDMFLFPKECIIDTDKRLLLKIIDNQLVDVKSLTHNFWIYPEDVGL
jgi:hypothetical protein